MRNSNFSSVFPKISKKSSENWLFSQRSRFSAQFSSKMTQKSSENRIFCLKSQFSSNFSKIVWKPHFWGENSIFSSIFWFSIQYTHAAQNRTTPESYSLTLTFCSYIVMCDIYFSEQSSTRTAILYLFLAGVKSFCERKKQEKWVIGVCGKPGRGHQWYTTMRER